MKLVSDVVFYWFLISMLVVVAFGYGTFEIVRLRRYFRRPVADRGHDELFGLIIGLLLCLYGAGGIVKHFAGW